MLRKFVSRAVAGVFLVLIRTYQLTLSSIMGRRCRYLPTCSEYAGDAIRQHGPWAGFWLALGRVTSCHPWGGHGYDGVPDAVPEKVWLFWQQRHGDRD